MKREQINQAIKERENLFMKEADYSPLSETEREKVRGYLKKYKPNFLNENKAHM